MGNEESIGQSGEYGDQFGANPTSMMSSNFNQRTNPGMSAGSLSSSYPTANRPMANNTNKIGVGFGNRPPGAASSMSAMPAMSPVPGPGLPLPDVDLSGLTEEEKMMIQSVMARAEQETGAEVGLSPIRSPAKPPAMNRNFNSRPNEVNRNLPQQQQQQPSAVQQQPQLQPSQFQPLSYQQPSQQTQPTQQQPHQSFNSTGFNASQQELKRGSDSSFQQMKPQHPQQTQQQQPKQQQNYSQEEYQRFQTNNSIRNQFPTADQNQYQNYSSTAMSSMTATTTSTAMTNNSVRDTRAHEMGSPSNKGIIVAPIPRTVPLHTVTQQLAAGPTAASSSPTSNGTSSPKQRAIQSQPIDDNRNSPQQQPFQQQLQQQPQHPSLQQHPGYQQTQQGYQSLPTQQQQPQQQTNQFQIMPYQPPPQQQNQTQQQSYPPNPYNSNQQDFRYGSDSSFQQMKPQHPLQSQQQQQQQQPQQQQKQQQNFSQEERYQTANQMRNQFPNADQYDNYSSTAMSSMTTTTSTGVTNTGVRDMRAHEMGSPSNKGIPIAHIPRTLPLHAVTQQLATSSAVTSSPPSSSTSSPKSKAIQSEQNETLNRNSPQQQLQFQQHQQQQHINALQQQHGYQPSQPQPQQGYHQLPAQQQHRNLPQQQQPAQQQPQQQTNQFQPQSYQQTSQQTQPQQQPTHQYSAIQQEMINLRHGSDPSFQQMKPQHPFQSQQQQQQRQQQNYREEECQRYQTTNQMRNQFAPSDQYQNYPSTAAMAYMTTTSTAVTTTSTRDIRAHEMGSPSHKPMSVAPIPRTVPLHTVTQQLATSASAVTSSPPSSSTSSPKHKSFQIQQQSYAQQLQPKRTPPIIQECWSPPTDLSPILDVSPSIEAAEQEIMEKCNSNEESLSPVMQSIPRATSGTITGMIADFNKAIEALGTTSPTEEQYEIASKLEQLERDSKIKSQRQQPIPQSVQKQIKKESNHKNPGLVRKASIESNTDSQPIIVMTSGPNQSTIPLQLQLNPQTVAANQALLPSPQVEQQLQQQQILIQQQQQFLQIQIEQQKLQKQMTEQLTQRQQQEMEKRKKAEKEVVPQPQPQPQPLPVVVPQAAPPKPEVVKQDKQVSTSTPPSITSTPTSASGKQLATTSATITRNIDPTVSASGVGGRKSLHRRLPHPTTEEMQTAVQTLAAAQSVQRTVPAVVSSCILQSSQRPISPLMPRKTQQSVISSQTILNPSTRRTNLSTSTVLTTATSTLVSSAVMPSTSIYDRVSPSPYTFGQSVLRSHTPITPGGDFSDSQSDVSGDKGKRRKLPSVPFDEEPVSPVLATRKLIKERLAGRAAISSTSIASKRIPPLRPSSSLDSATGLPTTQRRPQSPFSSSSDITQFLASTYGQSVMKSPIGNIKSPARSPIPPGESQIGRQLRKALSASSPTSPTRFPSYMKNIKQQLWEELKSATEEKYRLMSLRDRDNKDFYRRSETDLQTLYDIYSSPVRRRRGRYRSKYSSDSKIYREYSSREDMPFKSYEFESLHPTRTGIEMGYRGQRPMSSLAAYSDSDSGLRESVIPNMMDANENSLYLAANALNRSVRRRSEGSAEMMARFGYGLDPYGRSSTNYYYDDLTQQRRRLAGSRGTRSWNPSPYVSEDEDDHLTREEKAAKVRAEIKRRRQQMADSGRLYRHSIDGSGLQYGPMDDIYGQTGLTDEDYYNYNHIVHQMPKDYYNGRLRTNYSQPSLHSMHGHDNYGYQNYEPRMAPVQHTNRANNSRDAALLRRPNFAHPDMGSLMSATESDTPSDVFMDPMLNTPAMPILPDMPTRSRKLLEDLGSSPIASGGHRPGYGQNMMRGSPKKTQFAPNTTKYPKYPFPVKRILLTQDPKIRSVSGNGLGLKVVGGQEIPGSNMIGAYIQKIHPSLTMMGEIREGMQVIEWNGIPLTGISHDEVSRIISTQVGDEIEVVIRTDINMMANQSYGPHQNYDHQSDAYPQVILQHNHPIDESHHQMSVHHPQQHPHQQQYHPQQQQLQHQQQIQNQQMDKSNSQQVVEPIDQQSFDASPVNDDENKFDINDEQLGRIQGEIQLQICYDMKAAILYVTIIEAQNLMTLSSGQSPDPFVKCYLLPPRIVDNQRRTRYFYRCLNPKWKQTMVYPNIQLEDFKRKYLELSVWSFSIYTPHIFLGQVIIDLSETYIFDEDSHWYRLGGLDNEIKIKTDTFKYPVTHKRIIRRDDINIEKWHIQSETYTSTSRQPIIATSTRSKLTVLGERLNRHRIDRRRSCSSTESSRITNMSQLSERYGCRQRDRLMSTILPQTTGITAHPLLQSGCRGAAICNIL